ARRETSVSHRDRKHLSSFRTSAIQQLKHRNAIDDVVRLNGDLDHSGRFYCEPFVNLREIGWNSSEIVMGKNDARPVGFEREVGFESPPGRLRRDSPERLPCFPIQYPMPALFRRTKRQNHRTRHMRKHRTQVFDGRKTIETQLDHISALAR